MKLLTINVNYSGAPQLGYAGLYTATDWLARMFCNAGIDITEVCFGKDKSECVSQVSPQEASTLLATGQIDAIYTQYIQPRTPFEFAGMAWPKVVPVISICHDFVNAMEPIMAWLNSSARHPSDAAIVSSSAGAKALKTICSSCSSAKNYPPDIKIIPLGTERMTVLAKMRGKKQQAQKANNEVIYLWLGRFSNLYKADLRPLLLAIHHLHMNHPGFKPRLVAIGADQSCVMNSLIRFSRKLEIAHLCKWLPDAREEIVNSWLLKADVFVNVSDHIQETFGLVNLEAMAAGLPVIASDWSGFREIVKHGETGFLIPTSLDVKLLSSVNLDVYGGFSSIASLDMQALIKAMTILGRNTNLRFNMGKVAKKIIKAQYTSDQLAPRYIDLIKQRIRIAQRMEPRASSRDWMDKTFSHYPSISLNKTVKLKVGHIDIDCALETVDSPELRTEMEKVWVDIQKNKIYALPVYKTCLSAPLRRVAINLLLKLGVIAIGTDWEQQK